MVLIGRIVGYVFLSGFSLGVLGLGVAVGVGLLAYLLNAARFYAYAALVFIAFAGGEILSASIAAFDAFAFSVILAGALILFSGLAILVRFLRKYPIPSLEA
jgi:hypothetical protein